MNQRDLTEPRQGDKRFVRRGAKGAFITEVGVSWSLAGALCHRNSNDMSRGEGNEGKRKADPAAHRASFAPSIAGGRSANV